MLGDGIKQTTATTGSGALTLSAVTGYPKLSDVFAVGQLFSYTLLDSNGLLLEAGDGALTDATTMTRAKVCATFSGTTYANSAPSAISLSGTTTVVCTPHAATLESMLPTVDSQSASISRYLTSAHRNLATTTSGPSANNVQYMPFLLRCGAPVASLAVNVTTLGAGDTARAGLYVCNEKGYPGALLATTGSLDLSTTGVKGGTLAAPLFLPPGWYYTGFVASSGTPRLTAYSSGTSNQMGGSPLGFNSSLTAIELRTESVGSTALPATASTTSSAQAIGNIHPIIVHVGVA
jgi:hypothetical protein